MNDLPVKMGLNIVWVKPEHLLEFGMLAEECGYESLWSGEHVCLPMTPDWWKKFPGADALGDAFTEEMVPFGPDSIFLDPMIALAHLAAGHVHRAARHRDLHARAPGPRARRPHDRVPRRALERSPRHGDRARVERRRVPFTNNEWKTRGRRMNETIAALRVLFADEHPEFHGEFFDFAPIGFQPKPIQQRRLPIHIGGGGPPAVRRAAMLGDGWYGGPMNIPEIRDELRKAGRAHDPSSSRRSRCKARCRSNSSSSWPRWVSTASWSRPGSALASAKSAARASPRSSSTPMRSGSAAEHRERSKDMAAEQPLHGKAALVTGASRGVGGAIAKELAALGALVVVTARTDVRRDDIAGTIGETVARSRTQVVPRSRSRQTCSSLQTSIAWWKKRSLPWVPSTYSSTMLRTSATACSRACGTCHRRRGAT